MMKSIIDGETKQSSRWSGNTMLDKLRMRAAASNTGCVTVSIEELNAIANGIINDKTSNDDSKTA